MDKKNGLLLVLITAVVSGFSIFLNSFAVKGFDSSIFTFSKNLVVAILLLAVVIGAGQLKLLKHLKGKQWTQLAAIGLIGGSIPFLLFFKGLQMTSGQTGSFIHKTMFIFVAVFALFFLKEKITKGIFIGALLLIAGNFLMLRPQFSFSSGYLLVLAATLLWAAESVYSKHVLKELPGNIVAFGRMFFGSIFILAFLVVTGKTAITWSMSPAQYGWIGLSSVLLLVYVTSFYNGLRQVSVTTATCILSLGAPITTMLSWAFSGVQVTLFDAVGILLITAGIVIVVWFATVAAYFGRHFNARAYGRD
ncbi:MAG: DMT family transporter [Nanoarchaeota archaeon]